MPQDRESGARASEYGLENATALIKHLRGKNRKRGSNEFDLDGERVTIHSSQYREGRPQSVGVTLVCLVTVKSVLGAFQDNNGSYQIMSLPAGEFKKASRLTASHGPAKDRVVIVKRSVFEAKGKRIAVVPAKQ
ncbi:MAG: hypothetical protein LAO20_19675 [Acidobacteriia bacterium]|nr:hypothetical protein [Terriglobia bacterium]